jgi:hypothetical protein
MRESLILVRESLILMRESLILMRESLILVRESLILARESLILARESLILVRESLILVRESLILVNEFQNLINESFLRKLQLPPLPASALNSYLSLNFNATRLHSDFAECTGGCHWRSLVPFDSGKLVFQALVRLQHP